MHGLINRSIQCFTRDIYGPQVWSNVIVRAEFESDNFETMLSYTDESTFVLLDSLSAELRRNREEILEDLGTYLVSHKNVEALRRLLRFGGTTFQEFLHSLDDLHDRARLAVSDLELPHLELREHAPGKYSLNCSSNMQAFGPNFGHVMVGLLRAMADDYGSLVLLEHQGGQHGVETISIDVLESAFAEGRAFTLADRVS
ncbi:MULTISPECIES: heme NO-binding domain-containing protein [Falsihalocynthiibacter]|uniref:Heme NO-binding protein n=1 Tax=Falsihalocynthiibacter arcticus TaxID=1579316 RepID=A0A126V1P6_9RHOB|nr:heme NO-binding domain-containing protein [Falsihalocynthiibacter arcticus]AML51609.1 heme NO-binding protein [Falsihalocynthiibacter arcticus]